MNIGRSAWIALGVALLLLAGAIGWRVAGGRSAPGDRAAALAELEKRVSADPNDGAAWRDLGQAYFLAERFKDSATAYGHAVAVNPDSAELWSALGEARVLAANAVVPQAHDAFANALRIDPKDARARYFLGVEKDVAGDHKGAVADWLALLRDSPAGAPWSASVRQLVEQVAAREKIDIAGKLPAAPVAAIDGGGTAAAGIPGPTPEQMAAAGRLAPREQDEMARAMVERLAARLAENPRDAEGWVRLMRARTVLGDGAGARAALVQARKVFAGDAATREQLNAAARTLGIGG